MATIANESWIASYSCDGTNITIPIASLTGLGVTDAEDGGAGDFREVLLAILRTAQAKFDSLTPGSTRPGKMTIATAYTLTSVNVNVSWTVTHATPTVANE